MVKRASSILIMKLPGAAALSPATSPASPKNASAVAAALSGSGSTARKAPTVADAVQPVPVTLAISG